MKIYKKLFSIIFLTISLFAASSSYIKPITPYQKMFLENIKVQIFKFRGVNSFEQFKKNVAMEIKNTITRKNNLGQSLTPEEETKILIVAIMSNNIKLLKKLMDIEEKQ